MQPLKMSGKMKVLRSTKDEIQAMTVICNIQSMQKTVHGKCFAYSDFSDNTLDELYDLQDKMIIEYNKTFKTV